MKITNRFLSVFIVAMLLMTMFVSAEELPDEPLELLALSDAQIVAADKAAITSDSLRVFPLADGYLIDSLQLPTEGTNGSSITWATTNKIIIATDGTVKRHPTRDEQVTLTATYTSGSESDTEEFTFNVAALKTQVLGMPSLMGTLHSDHFNDGITGAAHIKAPASATESEGMMRVGSPDAETHVCLYAKPDKSSTPAGNYFVEYNLMREKADYIQIRLYGDKGNIVSGRWESNGSFMYYHNGGWSTVTGKGESNYKCKMSFYFDFETQKYTMWMNNELLLSDVPFRENNTAVNHNDIYFASSAPNTMIFDSYATYIPWVDMEDEERVNTDASELIQGSLLTSPELYPGYIDANLNLPEFGAFGSEILWESSDESVINTDGEIFRANDGGVKKAVLKATIKSGTFEVQKEFTFYVPGTELVISDKMTPIEYLVDEDFEDNDLQCDIIKNPTDPTGKYEMSGGKYNITRYDTSVSRTYVRMTYGNPSYLDQSPSGIFGIEFDVSHSDSYGGFNLLDSFGNYIVRGTYRRGGVMYLVYASTPNSDMGWINTNITVPNQPNYKIHYEILYDCRRGVTSVWANDILLADDVYSNPAASNFYYVEFCTDNENYGTFSIDNYKLYTAMPPTLKRLDYDLADFSLKTILNEEPHGPNGNFVTEDMNLMTDLEFGTEIEWSSSNPAVINPQTGEVNRPSAFDGNAFVTLTATFKSYGREVVKTFNVIVLSTAETSDEMLYADTDILTYELITDQNPDEIRTALNLMPKGVFGSDIVWESSNTEAIATSGRVIRQRWDGEDVPVTLTATIGGKNVKTFDFIVKAEEKLSDPQKVSDTVFFGKYQNGSWTTEPYLDYDYPGMEKVGDAVKNGNYEEAKLQLVNYMKNRPRKNVVAPAARQTQWVNYLANGVRDMQSGTHYRATSSIESSEYEKVSVYIANPKVSGNCFKAFRLLATYNDPVEISILGNTYPDESMRPKMVLNVNGAHRTYDATLASTVRCGDYMDKPHADPSELKVKTFGEFLGNETYQTVFRFDFDDLSTSDSVTYGELQFYAKKSSPYSEPKEFYVVADNNTTWDQEAVTWNDLLTVLHNYNGLVGEVDWYKVLHADVELLGQSPRFWGYPEMVSEYKYTGDEYYAYTTIKRMMDFDIDCHVGWYNTLTAGCRMDTWVPMFEGLLDSQYMDGDICTAIMKNMYSTCVDVIYYHNERGNWAQTEKLAMYRVFTLFPEFKRSAELRKHCTDFYQNQIEIDFFPDGSYEEDTEGYNTYAYGMYLTMWRNIVNSGYEVPEKFDQYILNAARAAAWFTGPGGEIMGYGDTGHGVEAPNQYTEVSRLHNDTELQFVDSRGTAGIEPSYTSKLFPDTTYAFMRSDWSKTCNYLFTQVRGYIGSHGHADDNSYILYSNGRCLLVDAGFVTYTDGPDRAAATSVRNHNTVEIDNTGQESPGVYHDRNNVGTTHYWTTNGEYDFLSQTARSYERIGNKHKRTTTFIKDDFVICSDYFEPTEKINEHLYRQSWHTPHDSDTSFAFEDGTFKTNYLTGANLMVLNADEDAVLLEGSGCWSNGYGNAIYIPYGYYEKTAVGDATLDTVLIPGEGSFDASVERLDTGVPTTVATALKIETNHSGVSEAYYYLLNYETTRTEKIFGKYKSDAQMVVVNEDEEGNITRIMLNGGTYVKNAAGEVIFKVDGGVSDISVSVENAICTIETSEAALDAEKIFFDFGQKVTALKICDAWKDFTQTGTAVGVLNGAGVSMDKTDNNQDLGIIDKPNAGGNAPGTDTPGGGGASGGGGGASGGGGGASGGGGGASGGGGGASGGPVTPGAAYPFADIQSHWGSEYIMKAYEKNIISGYEDNTFRPDEKISRAEFITLICRSFNIEKAEYNAGFEDVKESDWYAENIASAMKADLISKDSNFRPNDSITREEMSKIIAIAIEKFAQAEEIPAEWKNDFVDNDDISDWAKEYVNFVNYHQFILGRENGSFDPKANTSRAEAATVIIRIAETLQNSIERK